MSEETMRPDWEHFTFASNDQREAFFRAVETGNYELAERICDEADAIRFGERKTDERR